jgi:hypothetical protein
MADGFHIPIRNRTNKPLAIALSGGGRLSAGDDGSNVISVQHKFNQNCHYESLPVQ